MTFRRDIDTPSSRMTPSSGIMATVGCSAIAKARRLGKQTGIRSQDPLILRRTLYSLGHVDARLLRLSSAPRGVDSAQGLPGDDKAGARCRQRVGEELNLNTSSARLHDAIPPGTLILARELGRS